MLAIALVARGYIHNPNMLSFIYKERLMRDSPRSSLFFGAVRREDEGIAIGLQTVGRTDVSVESGKGLRK